MSRRVPAGPIPAGVGILPVASSLPLRSAPLAAKGLKKPVATGPLRRFAKCEPLTRSDLKIIP